MRSIILIIHLSVDGKVAGPNGDLGYFSQSDDNLAFVNRFTKGADTALFGRNSYDLLEEFWPQQRDNPEATQAEIHYSNWYNTAQKIVVSHTAQNYKDASVIAIHENQVAALTAIKQQPGGNILIFGAPSLSQTLIEAGLIDEFRVFIHPQFFGNGMPLFPALAGKVELELKEIHPLPMGQIALWYVKGK